MKWFNWLIIGLVVLCLATLGLAGCVSKSEYEALQANYTSLATEKQSVEADYNKICAEHEALQTEKTALEADKESLQADYDKVCTEHEALQVEKTALEADKQSLQADYDKLDADLEAVKKELDGIREVYPPRDFSSVRDLEDWLLANDVSEKPPATNAEASYGRAIEVQEDALKDGYIVSVNVDYEYEEDLFYIACLTVLNGDIWWWDPETDEPQQYFGLGKVK